MNNKFRSIKNKLARSLVMTLLAVIVGVLLLLQIVDILVYDAYIYNQLEEVAEEKKEFMRGSIDPDDQDHYSEELAFIERGVWIAHYSVETIDQTTKVHMDSFTRRLYLERDKEVINQIAELTKTTSKESGKLELDGRVYYYLFDKLSDTNTMVYYLADHKPNVIKILDPVTILLLIIIIPISNKFASALVKPIIELEYFAEEVAKRNWSVETPKTENDEIGQLAGALDRMKTALQVSEQRDRRFIQAASHDLKTPIMIIKGYAQAQIDGMTTESEEKTAEIIGEEASKLERRVTQLLHINSLGHTLEYVDNRSEIRLDRMLRRLTERFKVVRTDIEWDTRLAEIEYKGNQDALLIAFENIFENQIRYAKKHVCITLEKELDTVKISIGNDGPKFENENPQDLFDPYRKGLEGKFGLGLSIVRQVVEGHNGTVKASNADNGVLFELEFRL